MKINKYLYYLVGTISFFCLSCKEKPDRKPNIVFIYVDHLGYNDQSCMGSPFYETPNVDRIYNESMVFTNGYPNCQVCSPSRASLMSGKFTARHGITDYIGARTGEEWSENNSRFTQLLPPDYVQHLPHEYVVLPEALKEAEYLERMENQLMPRLEEQRRLYLSRDFDPGNNRWGSGGYE